MPPLPSRAIMRYRPAMSRPGRNLPSETWYSGKDEDREENREEERDELDAGRGGNGDETVGRSSTATSIVARSPVSEVGFPQDEQKRTLPDNCVPQKAQLDIEFCRIQDTAQLESQNSSMAASCYFMTRLKYGYSLRLPCPKPQNITSVPPSRCFASKT